MGHGLAVAVVSLAVVALAGGVGFVTLGRASSTGVAPPGRTTATTIRSSTTIPPISREDAEKAFAIALNLRRGKLHLKSLAIDPHWVAVARMWSAKMAATSQLAHNPDLVTSALPGWQKLGENVGVGGSVAALHEAFLHSPHHYENIVDPAFNEMGVGVVVASGTIWVTFDFEQAPKPPR
jgi:uncharacterized protein YkwD